MSVLYANPLCLQLPFQLSNAKPLVCTCICEIPSEYIVNNCTHTLNTDSDYGLPIGYSCQFKHTFASWLMPYYQMQSGDSCAKLPAEHMSHGVVPFEPACDSPVPLSFSLSHLLLSEFQFACMRRVTVYTYTRACMPLNCRSRARVERVTDMCANTKPHTHTLHN